MDKQSYRQFDVGQKSMDLVVEVDRLSSQFPDEEKFGLTSQMRRASTSIPSNIAEGYGRMHRGDYRHHVSIARGSLMELETQLIMGVRLEFVTREQSIKAWKLSQDVGQMLTKLHQSLR